MMYSLEVDTANKKTVVSSIDYSLFSQLFGLKKKQVWSTKKSFLMPLLLC